MANNRTRGENTSCHLSGFKIGNLSTAVHIVYPLPDSLQLSVAGRQTGWLHLESISMQPGQKRGMVAKLMGENWAVIHTMSLCRLSFFVVVSLGCCYHLQHLKWFAIKVSASVHWPRPIAGLRATSAPVLLQDGPALSLSLSPSRNCLLFTMLSSFCIGFCPFFANFSGAHRLRQLIFAFQNQIGTQTLIFHQLQRSLLFQTPLSFG